MVKLSLCGSDIMEKYKCSKCGQWIEGKTEFFRHVETEHGKNQPYTYIEKAESEVFDFDPVNKPLHYNTGQYEVIDVIEDKLGDGFEDYCMGNVMKYTMRYKHKNGIQDLEKAEWYLKRTIEWLKRKQDSE
jgi:hypothetical protein